MIPEHVKDQLDALMTDDVLPEEAIWDKFSEMVCRYNLTNNQLLEYHDYMMADLKRRDENVKKLEAEIDEDRAQLVMIEADLAYYKDLLEKHRKEKPEPPQCKT